MGDDSFNAIAAGPGGRGGVMAGPSVLGPAHISRGGRSAGLWPGVPTFATQAMD